MARFARVVVPDMPHHVTQRGDRRQRIFFEPGDEAIYLSLLTAQLERRKVACWSYCLTPNHVHLVLTPSDEAGPGLAVGEGAAATPCSSARGPDGPVTSSRAASRRWRWTKITSRPPSATSRSIGVKARLTKRPQDWPWSSTPALLAGRSTPHVDVGPALARIGDPAAFLAREHESEALWGRLLAAEAVGRPIGAAAWIEALEDRLGVRLTPKKRGPSPRDGDDTRAQGKLEL